MATKTDKKNRFRLLFEKLGLLKVKSGDLRQRHLKRLLYGLIDAFVARDFSAELLAHAHNNVPPWDGHDIPSQAEEWYGRYLGKFVDDLFSSEDASERDWFIQQGLQEFDEFMSEYVTGLADDALGAVQKLVQLGLKQDEIIAILTLEPLRRWKKVAQRFEDVLSGKEGGA